MRQPGNFSFLSEARPLSRHISLERALRLALGSLIGVQPGEGPGRAAKPALVPAWGWLLRDQPDCR